MQRKKPEVKVVEVLIKRRIVLERKKCKQCGKEFMGIKRKEYCSRACVEKAAYHRNLSKPSKSAAIGESHYREPITSRSCAVSTYCWKLEALPSRSFHT